MTLPWISPVGHSTLQRPSPPTGGVFGPRRPAAAVLLALLTGLAHLACGAEQRPLRDQPDEPSLERLAAIGYVSGVVPVEHSPSAIHFICVKHAKVYQVTFAALAGHHSGCTASNSFVPACQAAISRYCGSKGHATGFGPVEQSTDAWVVCLDAK